MPARPLPMLRKVHAIAFRGLVSELRKDVTLRRVVKTWRSWDGDRPDDDAAPFASDSGVSLRLTPAGSTWDRITIGAAGRRDVSLDVALDLHAPEGSADESANLWDAIEDLIASPAFVRAMEAHGVWDVEVTQPAMPAPDAPDLATARIRLMIST